MFGQKCRPLRVKQIWLGGMQTLNPQIIALLQDANGKASLKHVTYNYEYSNSRYFEEI